MFQTFLSYLVTFGLQNNVIVMNGSGALLYQREKMYRSLRYISSLFLVLGIIITSISSYFLYNYVYVKYDLLYIHISVVVLIVALYNLLVSFLWQKFADFKHYIYERSYSYAFDVVFTLSVILSLNMTLPLINFLMSILAIVIVVLLTNVIIGFFVESLNRGYLSVYFRNVPARLFLFALISILLYYAFMLVA